jgi:hypothetical protein
VNLVDCDFFLFDHCIWITYRYYGHAQACSYVIVDMRYCVVYIVYIRKMWGMDSDRKIDSVLIVDERSSDGPSSENDMR